MRPRPGREAAEYGPWLILICWIADVLTFRLLTSIPLTRMVAPPVPSNPLSRNFDTAATASSSKIGRLSSAPGADWSASAFAAAPVATWPRRGSLSLPGARRPAPAGFAAA